MFTTDGISFSARSANELGKVFALICELKLKIRKNNMRTLENFFFIYCFIYQISKNPMIANVNPPYLSWLLLTSFNFNSIFFIFDGNMAYNIPSINKKRPNAMINSFISYIIY